MILDKLSSRVLKVKNLWYHISKQTNVLLCRHDIILFRKSLGKTFVMYNLQNVKNYSQHLVYCISEDVQLSRPKKKKIIMNRSSFNVLQKLIVKKRKTSLLAST